MIAKSRAPSWSTSNAMAWSCTLQQLADAIDAQCDTPQVTFTGVSTDSRSVAPGQLFVALKGENFDGDNFAQAALERGAAAILSSATSGPGPRVQVPDTLIALQRFAAWRRRQCDIPLLALTGSCGKTTSKDFCAALLATRFNVLKTQGNLNNDIGVPLSLLRIEDETSFAVIEMGANHVGEIAELCAMAAPQECAVTLVAPAHLEGFGSIDRVAQAKFEIVQGLAPGGRFYVNVDNPFTRAMGERYDGPKIHYGSSGDVVLRACEYLPTGGMRLDIDPIGTLLLPLEIKAHAMNVLLAVAVGLQHGVTEFEAPLTAAIENTARFKVLRTGPLEVIDDTYNASPASMLAAIEALGSRPGKGRRIAALGSMLELGDRATELHQEIGEAAARLGISRLIARGPHAGDIIRGAALAGLHDAEVVDDHETIAHLIQVSALPGDVLLLKGSRGMRMERVLTALRVLYGEENAQ